MTKSARALIKAARIADEKAYKEEQIKLSPFKPGDLIKGVVSNRLKPQIVMVKEICHSTIDDDGFNMIQMRVLLEDGRIRNVDYIWGDHEDAKNNTPFTLMEKVRAK